MLDTIRLTLSIIFFCLGLYSVYSLFASGFSFMVLGLTVVFFALAHYTKPKKSNADDWASALDFIISTIDIPFRVFVWLLRVLCRPFRGDIDGFDL